MSQKPSNGSDTPLPVCPLYQDPPYWLFTKLGVAFLTPSCAPSRPRGGGGGCGGIFGLPAGRGGGPLACSSEPPCKIETWNNGKQPITAAGAAAEAKRRMNAEDSYMKRKNREKGIKD